MEQELLQKISEKERELNNLNSELEDLREKAKAEIMKGKGFDKVIWLLNQEFESSSQRTPQYLEAHRTFKREFSKILNPICKKIEISKPNHFDITGFFQLEDDRIYYFSVGDLRWDKVFLIRIAKDFKDYTGGSNNFLTLDNNFIDNLLKSLDRWKNYDRVK